MDLHIFLTIILIAFSTYLTRIIGYLELRNRKLSPTTEKVMEAIPGCVLISVIAPVVLSGDIANTLAVILTFFRDDALFITANSDYFDCGNGDFPRDLLVTSGQKQQKFANSKILKGL